MNVRRALPGVAAALAWVLLAGCASVPASAPGGTSASSAPVVATNPADPWENWNRKVYAFNDTLDKAVAKPVAEAYRKVVPALVRTGVDNVLGNLHDVWSTANQFLQGKLQNGLEMGMRVLTNTFFGLGGLLDPASEMNLVKRSTDFGQTLGRWGVGSGPYMVLPLLGPSTVRGTAGLLVDRQAAPSRLPDTSAGSYSVTALELLNTRTNLLSAGQLLDDVALDRYSFLRDAYLARQRDAQYDGAPPMETFEDEGADPKDAKPPGPAAAAPAASSPSVAASSASK